MLRINKSQIWVHGYLFFSYFYLFECNISKCSEELPSFSDMWMLSAQPSLFLSSRTSCSQWDCWKLSMTAYRNYSDAPGKHQSCKY